MLQPPSRVEYTWMICESVSVALDAEAGGFATAVYFYEKRQPLSEGSHDSYADAEGRVAKLVAGGWRDYFDDHPELLAGIESEIAAEREAEARERQLAEEDASP